MRFARALALAIVALLDVPVIATPAVDPATLDRSVGQVKTLMLSGRSSEAQTLLRQLAGLYRNNNDVDFLLGMLAMDSADYSEAIRRFRAILVRKPDAVRVRLELARTFYLDGDYENAYRNFQFARAGNPSSAVIKSIDQFLINIRHQKNWSYSLSFAVAPDTNINNGTSAEQAVLFGLPFELDRDSRRRSGVGLAVDAATELAPRIGARTRLRFGAAVQRHEYGGQEFDDMIVALHAGPRVTLDRWDLGVVATAYRRWFGGTVLNDGAGAKAEVSHYLDARTTVSGGGSVQRIHYPHYKLQSGTIFGTWAGVERALSADSSVNAHIAISRKTAKTPELANRSGSISAGYYRDLPGGFSIYAEPTYSVAHYDAEDPFFAIRRVDRLIELRLAILNRRIVLSRFTPRVALTVGRRRSSINVYNYAQRRLEVGVTSAF